MSSVFRNVENDVFVWTSLIHINDDINDDINRYRHCGHHCYELTVEN